MQMKDLKKKTGERKLFRAILDVTDDPNPEGGSQLFCH